MASIRERNGKFQITISCGRDIYGHKLRETTTFVPTATTPKKIEKEVAAFAAEFEQKVLNGAAMDGRKITLAEFVERWQSDYAKQELEPGTIQGYQRELDKKILPSLGHLKLSELKPTTVNHFFVSLTKDGARHDGKPGGYAKGSIMKTFNVLSCVLRVAVQWELIDANPCEKVRFKAEDAAETVTYFTPEQASDFLASIEKPYYVTIHGHKRVDDTGKPYTVGDYKTKKEVPEQIRVLLNLAIFSGLRKGELLALEFDDVDFENNSITVSKSLSVVGGKPVIKAPKTKSGNRVVLSPVF